MSDELTPAKKRGRPRNAAITAAEPASAVVTAPDVLDGPPKIGMVAPRSEEGAWSQDDVLAARLAGQPFGVRAEAIPLREPARWHLYIANSAGDEGRHYDMVHRKGWAVCTTADLAPGILPESIGFRVNEAGALVRGHRGDEVVYKMPKAIYEKLQRAKAERNVAGQRSESKARSEVAEAAAAAHGDQAAEFLYRNAQIDIKDSHQSGV